MLLYKRYSAMFGLTKWPDITPTHAYFMPYCYNQNWALQIKRKKNKNCDSGFLEECSLIWIVMARE